MTTTKELVNATLRMVKNADARELGKLTVSEIARRLMVNRSTLSRAFRAYFPYITLKRYLETSKFRKFDVLIWMDVAKTVKEALEILDIRDAGHFIRRYKAYFCRTPGEICRKHKEERKRWTLKWAEK